MMIPVVFDSEHQFLPTHIQVVLAIPVRADYRNLSLRARIPGANQQEPQRCFPRRLGAAVNQVQRRLELAQTPRVPVPGRQLRDGGGLEIGGARQRVQALDGTADPVASAQVECCALRSGHRQPV
jgi:hypothetical protein